MVSHSCRCCLDKREVRWSHSLHPLQLLQRLGAVTPTPSVVKKSELGWGLMEILLTDLATVSRVDVEQSLTIGSQVTLGVGMSGDDPVTRYPDPNRLFCTLRLEEIE